jgi:nitrite reductase/ring-hydroxylating ferredoxin subunit
MGSRFLRPDDIEKMLWRKGKLKFVQVASQDDIPSGSMKSYSVEGATVLVANVDGRYYAINNRCSHAGGDLSKGQLNGNIVKCPRHGSQFDVTTGKRIAGPAAKDQPTYEVKLEGNKINIKSG